MAPRVEKTDARQGDRGKSNFRVLLMSLGLLVVAIVALMIWQGTQSPPDYASKSQDASRREVTGSASGGSNAASSSNSSAVPAGNPAYPSPSVPSASGTKP